MPPNDLESRVTRLETQRESSSEEHKDMWSFIEKQGERIDSLERTRDTLDGVRVALWFIAAAFLAVLGGLVHVTQMIAAVQK